MSNVAELGQLCNIQISSSDSLWSLGKKKKVTHQPSTIYGIVSLYSEKAKHIGFIKEMETFVFKEM